MYKWKQIMVTKPLCSLNEGENGKIVQIRGKVPTHRCLYEMGLTVGRNISIKKTDKTTLDSSVTIEAAGKLSTLGNKLAQNIRVEVPIAIDERIIPELSTECARLDLVGNKR